MLLRSNICYIITEIKGVILQVKNNERKYLKYMELLNKNKFSKEWIIAKCNYERHCLLIHLKSEIIFNNLLVDTIFVLNVNLSQQDIKAFESNIDNNPIINTYGELSVTAFVKKPFDKSEITIDTSNIEEIEIYKP